MIVIDIIFSKYGNFSVFKENVHIAISNLRIKAEVNLIYEIKEIHKQKVIWLPAIIVNEEIASQGEFLSLKQTQRLISDVINPI